jgi:hypothetical protein
MNPEKSRKIKDKREFGGCVELIPPQPKLIEFIGTRRTWGFPIDQLTYVALEEIQEHRNQPTLPPDRLVLVYELVIVILHGWRLELMLGPLLEGRVARVHAEKHLGTLIIEEAWVSKIRILPLVNSDLLTPSPPQ